MGESFQDCSWIQDFEADLLWKVSLKMLIYSFDDLFFVHLWAIDHFKLEIVNTLRHTASFKIWISKFQDFWNFQFSPMYIASVAHLEQLMQWPVLFCDWKSFWQTKAQYPVWCKSTNVSFCLSYDIKLKGRVAQSVGNVSDCRYLSYFRGDWSWKLFLQSFSSLPLIQEELLSVTSKSMCMKYWLTT